MSFVHKNPSIVELIALAIAALVALTLIIEFFINLPGLMRYLRIKAM